jgi:hypothetical protein
LSNVYVRQAPDLRAAVVGALLNNTRVQIQCTAQGDTATANGHSSSLWDFAEGGYVPDVFIDTGTNQATMPNC